MCLNLNVAILLVSTVLIIFSLLKLSRRENMAPINLVRDTVGVLNKKDFQLNCPQEQKCSPENNCFIGSYMRSQVYQNTCEPKDNGPLKEPRKLRDYCLRSLGNPNISKLNLKCKVNKHDQINCNWH